MPVSFPIRLEGDPRAMRFSSVELDDKSLRSPEAIGLNFGATEIEQRIELWIWQPGARKKRGELVLELASGSATGPSTEATQAGLDRARSAPSGVPFEHPFKVMEAKPVQIFGLADRSFKAVDGRPSGNIEEGSGKCGDGNPAPHSHLV
jgi:hypothetical protein